MIPFSEILLDEKTCQLKVLIELVSSGFGLISLDELFDELFSICFACISCKDQITLNLQRLFRGVTKRVLLGCIRFPNQLTRLGSWPNIPGNYISIASSYMPNISRFQEFDSLRCQNSEARWKILKTSIPSMSDDERRASPKMQPC